MADKLFIPKLGQTVEEVTLIRWLVDDGQEVEQGQEVLEVETDKAVFNVEATTEGFIHIGPFKQDAIIPVLTVVAIIGKPDDIFQEISTPEAAAGEPEKKQEDAKPIVEKNASLESVDKIFISPRARRLAAANDIDLHQIKATGAGGIRITESDVSNYLAK